MFKSFLENLRVVKVIHWRFGNDLDDKALKTWQKNSKFGRLVEKEKKTENIDKILKNAIVTKHYLKKERVDFGTREI